MVFWNVKRGSKSSQKELPTLACVTGASSGIGEALCRLMAEKKINLMITGRNVIRLNALAEELRSQVDVHVFPGDLIIKEDREMLIQNIYHYQPDLVVNNAGMGLYGDALTHKTSEEMEVFAINAEAVLEISLEAARAMISAEKKGVIMNISSMAAHPIFPGLAVYSASKAFVNQFSISFDEETRPYGVRVLASSPGMVATKFKTRASKKYVAEEPNGVMTAEFAAKEIWDQIQSKRKIWIFDWKYRLLRFLIRIIPNRVIAFVLHKNMKSRSGDRPIIKK